MVTFTILAIALVALLIFTVIAVGVLGGSVLIIFGDVIVFGLIVAGIVKFARRND